jgi:replicative DNA helicase
MNNYIPPIPKEDGFVESEIGNVPHSIEAEEAVVGSVLINPLCFYELSEFLKKDSFYIHRNGWVWESFEKMKNNHTPIDMLTVTEILDRDGKLDEIGGVAYLTSLVNQVPTSMNSHAYAKIVQEHAIRRDLLKTANRTATIAYDLNKDPLEAIHDLAIEIEGKQNNIVVEDDFQPLKSVMSDVYDEMELRTKDPKPIWGIPTGFSKVDYETGGQQYGELNYWVGESGIGKTWLLLGMGLKMSEFCPGGFLSMELKRQNIGRRILSGTSGVSNRAIRSGMIDEKDWALITNAIDENVGRPLYLMYKSVSSQQLFHIVRQAKRKYNIGFLIVDYAMLFNDEARDDTERTGIVSRNLKTISTDFDISVHCIHSVTKSGMDQDTGDPAKSYMRGSGQQIHDADNIYFLTKYHQTDPRDGFLREDATKNMATLWCKKGRDMENSDFHVHLVRKGKSPFFAEYSRISAQQDINGHSPEQQWQKRLDIGDD